MQTLLFQRSVCLPGVGSQWDFWGSTLVTSSYVRLTPDERSKQGSIWNTVVRKETGTRLLSQFQCRLYGQQHMILHFTVCNPPTPPPHKHPRTRLSRFTQLYLSLLVLFALRSGSEQEPYRWFLKSISSLRTNCVCVWFPGKAAEAKSRRWRVFVLHSRVT